MSSRSLTRESGSSYLVKFFEDDDLLIVNRSRIFKDGRLNVCDSAKVQWGNTQEQCSDGEILEVGDYCNVSKTLKALKTSSETQKKPPTKKTSAPPKKRKAEEKENQPRKKLKSGKPAAKMILISEPKWQKDALRPHNQQTAPPTASEVQPPPPTATVIQQAPSTATEIQQAPSTATEIQPPPPTATVIQQAPSTATEIQQAPPTATEVQQAPPSATQFQQAPPTATEVQQAPPTATEVQQAPPTSTEVQLAPPTATEVQQAPPTATEIHQAPPTSTEVQLAPPTATEVQLVPPTATEVQQVPHTATEVQQAPPTATEVQQARPTLPPAPLTPSIFQQTLPSYPSSQSCYQQQQTWDPDASYSQEVSDYFQSQRDSYTAFLFPDSDVFNEVENSIRLPSTPSTGNVVRQAMALMSVEEPAFQRQPSTPGPRQLFENDVTSPCAPFTDLFASPNIHDRRIAQSWDRKVDAMNKKLSTLSRQVNEVKTMMTYIVQKLDSITSGTLNVSSDIAQCTSASSKGPVFDAPSASTTVSHSDGISTATTTAIDEQFSDVPLHCRIPADEVLKMKRHSKSIGNFAALMTIRLFPELFTPEHQRFRFNYYGNGNQKEALESQRRSYLQRYMLYFFPQLSDPKAFHEKVVDPVNEILRRKKLSVKTLGSEYEIPCDT